jgi:hypothetical protein
MTLTLTNAIELAVIVAVLIAAVRMFMKRG